MILTGKAVRLAEEMETLLHDNKIEKIEMDELEQVFLFFITRTFETDRTFRLFIQGCTELFSKQIVKGKGELLKLLLLMEEVNNKCLSQS